MAMYPVVLCHKKRRALPIISYIWLTLLLFSCYYVQRWQCSWDHTPSHRVRKRAMLGHLCLKCINSFKFQVAFSNTSFVELFASSMMKVFENMLLNVRVSKSDWQIINGTVHWFGFFRQPCFEVRSSNRRVPTNTIPLSYSIFVLPPWNFQKSISV